MPSQMVWHCASRSWRAMGQSSMYPLPPKTSSAWLAAQMASRVAADLRERHEDAADAPAFVLVGRGAARGRALEGQRHAGLELDEQVDQRLAHERVAVDALTPLLASGRVDRGFEERPAVDAEAHDRDAEPAAVDHLHHAGQAAARPPPRTSIGGLAVCAGAPASHARAPVSVTSAVGTPTVPSFGLRRLMWKPFGEPSGSRRGTMKVDRPARAVGRALGPREDDEDLGVDVRAEVLVAEEPPLVAVRDGAGRVGTDVAAALAFGQEHPAFPRLVGVEAPEPAHELVAHRCRRVALDDVGGARRHAEPAVDGGLGLAHEVRERGGEHRGHGPPGVRRAGP